MILKRNIKYNFLLFIFVSIGLSEINVVSYGWEVFDRNTDSRTTSLAQSGIAYPIQTSGTTIINPALSLVYSDKIGLTHQSKIGGTLNSEFIGFDKYIDDSSWVSIVMLYEGVNGIPDTRSALLDWGIDGVFGTFDTGEGNGILDEGERLDSEKIKFFSQNIFGLYGSHSKQIGKWNVGFGLKFLLHSLNSQFRVGAGLDIGLFRSYGNVGLGLVFNNLPSSGVIWESGEIEVSTPSMHLGLHQRLTLHKYQLEINPILKGSLLSSNRSIDSELIFGSVPMDFSAGVEIIYKNNLFFRFGAFQRGAFSSGIGLFFKDISIDYAFLSDLSTNGIDKNHLLSISVSRNWIKRYLSGKI